MKSLALFVLIFVNAIQQLRANRRQGIRVEWRKTLITGVGCVLITLTAIGVLIVLLDAHPILGSVGFVVIFVGGIAALVVFYRVPFWNQRSHRSGSHST